MEIAEKIKRAFKDAFAQGGGFVPSVLVIDNSFKVSVARAEHPPAPTTKED